MPMIRGLYLVDRRRRTVDEEVGLLRKAMDVDLQPMIFDNVVPTVGSDDGDGILLASGERIPVPDVVITRAFGLSDSESYHLKAVLRMLEGKGALCINPAECKDITSDKLRTFQVASQVIPEIPIPRTMLVTPEVGAEQIAEYTGYPVVLKTLHGEGGDGVFLVDSEPELKRMISLFRAFKPGDQMIAQQAIMSSKGRDMRVMVSGNGVIGAFMRNNPSGFRSNVHQGGRVEDYDPPEHVKAAAVKFARAIGMVIGGVDFLFGEKEGEFYLCEANSSIGMSMETFDEVRSTIDAIMQRVDRGPEGKS